jgi:hypothetical protein
MDTVHDMNETLSFESLLICQAAQSDERLDKHASAEKFLLSCSRTSGGAYLRVRNSGSLSVVH